MKGWALLLVAMAAPAAARFAPVEGQRLRETVIETREEAGRVRRFELSRSIVFARDGIGWRARVTFEPVIRTGRDPVNAQFEAIMAAFAGTTMEFRLDGAGAIVGIMEEDAMWRRFVRAVAGAAGSDRAAATRARAVADALATLPSEQRRAILAEPLAPLLAGADADRAVGTRPVTVPAAGMFDGAATLAGTETTTREVGTVVIRVEAEGRATISDAAAVFTLRTCREVDGATGLLRAGSEESTSSVALPAPVRQSRRREITIIPVS